MINKILKILIPFILVGIIISIGYNAYIKTQKSEISPIEVIPNNASIIIQLNNVKNLSRYLKKSTIWSKLKSIDIIDSISNNADNLNRIFESFIQEDTSVTRKFGGTGLGLTVTKAIIEEQYGKLLVESTLGKGSKFTIVLNPA